MGSFGNIVILTKSKHTGTKFDAEDPYPEGFPTSQEINIGSSDFSHIKLEMQREESYGQLEVEALFNLIRRRLKEDKEDKWLNIWMRHNFYKQDFDFLVELEPEFVGSVLEILPQAFLRILGNIYVLMPPTPNNSENWPCPSSLGEPLAVDASLRIEGELIEQKFADIISIPNDHKVGLLLHSRSQEKVFYFEWEIAIVWNSAPLQLAGDKLADILYSNEPTKDVTIVVGSGAQVKCHGIILSAQSPVFARMVSPNNGMKESQTGIVEMKENSENGIRLMLLYLYGKVLPPGELSPDVALELFELAHMYKLGQLEEVMKKLFHNKIARWFTPDMILELYFYVSKLAGYKKLQMHSLKIMKRMTANELRNCNRYQGLTADEKEGLHWKLFEVKK